MLDVGVVLAGARIVPQVPTFCLSSVLTFEVLNVRHLLSSYSLSHLFSQIPPRTPLLSTLILRIMPPYIMSLLPLLRNSLKLMPHILLCLAHRRIVVHRENTNTRSAARTQHLRLPRQITITIDTNVATSRHDILISEQSRGLVEYRNIIVRPTSQSGLNECRINTRIIRERGDERRVDTDSIAQWKKAFTALCILHKSLDNFNSELGLNRSRIRVARRSSLVDPLVGALFTVSAAEGYGWIASAYGGVRIACSTGESVQKGTEVEAKVGACDNEVGLSEVGEVGKDVVEADEGCCSGGAVVVPDVLVCTSLGAVLSICRMGSELPTGSLPIDGAPALMMPYSESC